MTRNVPAPWDGLPITDTAGVVSRDNDFDNRLSTDSSYYGGFVRGNYDASGAFVGARPTANRGIITTSGTTAVVPEVVMMPRFAVGRAPTKAPDAS